MADSVQKTSSLHDSFSNAPASSTSTTPSQVQQQQQQAPKKLSPSAVLAQCLKLLKGDSDEHKFAGLVMVTKHVPALTAGRPSEGSPKGGDSGSVGQLRQICDAVGPAFVHRLLRTAGGSSDRRTKDAGSGAGGLSVYQQIALGVLAAFFQDESLVVRFVPVAPALVRTIRAANAAAEAQGLCDALHCAQALAAAPGGMERLLRAGAPTAVVNRLASASRDRRVLERETECKTTTSESGEGGGSGAGDAREGHGNTATCSSPEGLGGGNGGSGSSSSGPAERAETLAFAFVGRALEASAGGCLGTRELTAIAEAFRDDPTQAKFGFMDLLLRWAALQEAQGGVLVPRDPAIATVEEGDPDTGGSQGPSAGRLEAWTRRGPFPAALREGLLQALHGAADDERRDSALALLASLLRALGQEWAVETNAEGGGEGGGEGTGAGVARDNKDRRSAKKKERKRGTFVAFAVRCAAGEVRILLDESLSLLSPGTKSAGSGNGAEPEVAEKARGPMGPPGVDPSIGIAAEIAAASGDKGGDGGVAEEKGGQREVALPAHEPLPAAQRDAIRERRTARLLRMVPVGLGVAESTIAFLCGGEDPGDEEDKEEDEEEEVDKAGGREEGGSGRWEDLPIETLQDLQKTLIGLFGCVFDFMAEIRPWIVPSAGASEDATGEGPAPSLADIWVMQRLGLECSRALGIWVAEDPESLPQRFLDALPVLLALRARAEPPDSDDEDSDDEIIDEEAMTPTLAAFPGADGGAVSTFPGDVCRADEALHNVLRAMLALSYEAAPLAAMVEEGVAARLAILAAAGPSAIAALLPVGSGGGDGGGKNAAAVTLPLPPREQVSEAVRSPLITACGLLTNILTSAGHLAWPEKDTPSCASLGRARHAPAARAPSHPVLAHPAMGECLASLAEVASLAGAARRRGGGPRWRLLAAHATLVVMTVARAAAPGNGLAPVQGLAERQPRWGAGRVGGDRSKGGGARVASVWRGMARAVDEALGSLSATDGRGLIGAMGDEEASYEEGNIWQWCLECAREMEALSGGADGNPYVSGGLVPRRMLESLIEASSDGRI